MSVLRFQGERGPHRLVAWASGLFVLAGVAVLATLAAGAWPLVTETHLLANLVGGTWDPLAGRLGLAPFLLGTAAVTGLAIMIAVPFSLGAGVAVARELAGGAQDTAVRILTILTAVPSVLFGWWGLLAIVPWVRAHVGGAGFSLLAAGLVLAVMLIPTLSLLFYQALEQVPGRFQLGSTALGATPDQTLVRLVIPCALPALVQALLVGLARAIGETIAVQMVIGGQPSVPSGLASPGATLTTQILTDLSVFPPGTQGHAVLDFMALVLMAGMYLLVRATERWGAGR